MTISHKYKDILQVASMTLFGSLNTHRFCGVHHPPIKVEGKDRKGVVVASKHPHPHEGYFAKPHEKGSHEDHILHHHHQQQQLLLLLLFLRLVSKDRGGPLPNHLLPMSSWVNSHNGLLQNPEQKAKTKARSMKILYVA